MSTKRKQRTVAAWASLLRAPAVEPTRSRRMAHVGGVVAVVGLVGYLSWRVAYTLPVGGWNRSVALALVTFEALPLIGLVVKAATLWNIDAHPAPDVAMLPEGTRVVVLIPTYNEPLQVIAPTVVAACALAPAHETWVLDDGDRPWVADMCAAYGARYVSRPTHDHAKAGNLNHALDVLAADEAAGGRAVAQGEVLLRLTGGPSGGPVGSDREFLCCREGTAAHQPQD